MPHLIPAASSVRPEARGPVADGAPEHVRVAIIGSGFAGVAMSVSLRRAGITDFVMLERGAEVGGTWRDNTYPGAGCDVPSQLYSLSFAPNPTWSKSFSLQPEIQAYLLKVVDDFDLRPHVRLRHEVLEARWQDATGRWEITTTGGSFTAEILVSGAGPLADPTVPDVPGLADFRGAVFHSAVWDHSVDLEGKKVAVIGTGASAVQFVPQIAGKVEQLHLLQRTPPWILPRAQRDISGLEHRLYTRVPAAQKVARAGVFLTHELATPFFTYAPALTGVAAVGAKAFIASAIKDPELRRTVTPKYRLGCKRVLLSNEYYPALARENVEVLDSGLAELTPTGVRTADGREREADVVIFGTGFSVEEPPIASRIVGRHGATLADLQRRDGKEALRGTTVPGFPNLFLLIGPNSGVGHTSMVYIIESQVAYVMAAVRALDERDAGHLDPRPQATKRWNGWVQSRLRSSVWNTGGCSSWYLDSEGRNRTMWPGSVLTFRRKLRRLDVSEYRLGERVGSRRYAEVAGERGSGTTVGATP